MSNKGMYTQSNTALAQQGSAGNEPRAQLVAMKSFLDSRTASLEKWAMGRIKPEALIRFMLLDLQQNPKLAACSRESIFLTLLACAAVGLEPGALHADCFAVPFGGKAQFMMGWRGLVKLARRSGEVSGIVANVVYSKDAIDIDLCAERPISHKPFLGEDRGEIIGAYAQATMRDGHREPEWMGIAELNKVRAVSEKRGGGGPAWKDFADQMLRKAPVRRLAKRLPLGNDYYIAQAIDSASDVGKDQKDVLDIVTDGEASRSEAQLARAPSVAIDPPADDFADAGAQS